MRYRAQLGGAAQLQLYALIEIERRGKVVSLNPDEITGRGRFNQQQRVNHLGGVGIFQEPLTFEPVSADEIRVSEPAEMWRRVLAAVSTYNDLETPLLGAVERLIDFVTDPGAEPTNGGRMGQWQSG